MRSAPLTGASPQSSFFSWPSVVLRKAGKARLRTALHPRRKARSPASQLFIPSDTEIFLCLRPSKNPRSTAIVCEQRSAARSPTGRGLRTAVALSGLSSSSVLRTLFCGLPRFARRPNPVLCLCSASLGRGSLDNNVFFLTIPSAAAGSPAEFSTRRPAFPASAAMPPGRWTRRPSAGKRLHSGRHVRR